MANIKKSITPSVGRYIDPLTDFGFKYLFGEPNKFLLIGFLNAVLSGRKTITDLQYGPAEQHADLSIHRGVTVDLFCTGLHGEKFIVEMQRANQEFFKDRSLFYISRVISRQQKKGNKRWDYELPEIYFVGIIDFCFDDTESKKYFHDVHLTDRNTGERFYDKLSLLYIELPNFTKEYHEGEKMDKVPELDKWIYLLKHLSQLRKEPAFLNEWIFRRIFKLAKVANLKEKERMSYESSLKAQRDYYSTISYAEKKAMEKGMERGMEKGMEKGKEQVVKNLIIELGLSDQQAARIAEIPVSFVKKIRTSLKKKKQE